MLAGLAARASHESAAALWNSGMRELRSCHERIVTVKFHIGLFKRESGVISED